MPDLLLATVVALWPVWLVAGLAAAGAIIGRGLDRLASAHDVRGDR